jgi:flagellar motor switch protein FliG
MATKKLTGPEKAAILLLTLGEDVAAEIMKSMDVKEIRRLGNLMARTQDLSPEAVEQVIREFYERTSTFGWMAHGGEGYIKNILVKALGSDKADKIMDQVSSLTLSEESGLETLKWLDHKTIANIVKMEHPQTIALILTYLGTNLASQVLGELPAPIRGDVALRVATLDTIPPGMVKELEEALQSELSVSGQAQLRFTVGGVKMVAEMLNQLDRSAETAVFSHIEQGNPEIAQQIRDLMFVFDDLSKVDDRGIQEILKEVKREDLVLALKGADDAMKEKIFKNMSERARQTLKDDMEAKGPVKLKDVEKAQKDIIAVARKLSEEGKIVLGGVGAEEVVL